MKGNHYVSLESLNGNHRYVLIEWNSHKTKSLSESRAKRISKREASTPLFIDREY